MKLSILTLSLLATMSLSAQANDSSCDLNYPDESAYTNNGEQLQTAFRAATDEFELCIEDETAQRDDSGNVLYDLGNGAKQWGYQTKASGYYSTAWGYETNAEGYGSTAWGARTKASISQSTAWGSNTEASNSQSTAWGYGTKASGFTSTSWGSNTEASGIESTAWGLFTEASGDDSTAFGVQIKVSGEQSVGIGLHKFDHNLKKENFPEVLEDSTFAIMGGTVKICDGKGFCIDDLQETINNQQQTMNKLLQRIENLEKIIKKR